MTIGIICHDAGGAEILSSYCKTYPDDYLFSLQGPAIGIFERKIGITQNHSLERVMERVSSLFTGTSGASNFEREALKMAKSRNIATTSFLDHWINYEERFRFPDGSVIFPDSIVVADLYAKSIALKHFPTIPIQLIENPYLREIGMQNRKKEAQGIPNTCMYVSSGLYRFKKEIVSDKSKLGFDDRDIITALLTCLKEIDETLENIVIRPHPNEEGALFDELVKSNPSQISISGNKDIVQDLINYEIVMGFDTMALVVGLHLGLRAISLLPDSCEKSSIPYPEIEKRTLNLKSNPVNNYQSAKLST